VGYRVKENTYTNATSTKRPLASAPNYKSALEQMTTPLSFGTSKKCSIYLRRRSMLLGGLLDSPSSTLSCGKKKGEICKCIIKRNGHLLLLPM